MTSCFKNNEDVGERQLIRSKIDSIATDLGNYPISNEHLDLDKFGQKFKSKEFDTLVLICGGGMEPLRLVSLLGNNADHIYIVDKDQNSIERFKLLLKIMEEEPAARKEDFSYYLRRTKAEETDGMFYMSILDKIHIDRNTEDKIRYLNQGIADAMADQIRYPEERKYFVYMSNIIGSGWAGKSEEDLLKTMAHSQNVKEGSAIMLVSNNNRVFFVFEKDMLKDGHWSVEGFPNAEYTSKLRTAESF